VEYSEWLPQYRRIQSDFEFQFDREEACAEALLRHLPRPALEDPLGRLGRRLRGRDVVVVGQAPGWGPPPVWRLTAHGPKPVLIAADGATTVCLDAGLTPDLITTDLDGPVASETSANAKGAFVVVHAHGDNREAVERWVPDFSGELAGSWAGPPRSGLLDVGGFTDGDRAAFLADHLEARSILLWGFDFDRVAETDPLARDRKRAKLRWAKRLLGWLAQRHPGRLHLWSADGTIAPFPAQPPDQATQ
jgi:uncharacterized Rossmann fold enzyme